MALTLLGLLVRISLAGSPVLPAIASANCAFGTFLTIGRSGSEERHSNFPKPILRAFRTRYRVSASLLSSWLRFFPPKPVEVQEQESRELLFFNRELEIRKLTNLFHGLPKFTLVLGPPSTGKTRLIDHVTRSVKADGTRNYHVLQMNLRGVEIENGQALWRYVEDLSLDVSTFDKAWRSFARAVSRIRISKTLASNVEVEVGRSDSTIETAKNNLFHLIESIPVWDGLSASDRPFVLVVDEANALKNLASGDFPVSFAVYFTLFHSVSPTVVVSCIFEKAFREFMQFVIRISKEQRRLHVIFTSSDSFFERWIINQG